MNTHSSIRYRPDIDGLRGIAVLGVVLFHAFPGWLPSGFVGVDVFFVISGYLITSIILAEVDVHRFSFTRFYARRVRRIFPSLAVVLTATLVAGWLFLFPDEFTSLSRQIWGGAAFVANLVLWQQTGYFDDAAAVKPLLHLWSLGVEEQFYIGWPVLLLVCRTTRMRWIATIGVFLLSLALNLWFAPRSPDANFYLPMTRLWELLAGAMIALGSPAARTSSPARSAVMAAAGAVLLAGSFALIDGTRPFPGWRGMLPVAGTALCVMAGTDAWLNRRVLASRALVGIGLISYPLYLWHWPLLAFRNILVGVNDPAAGLSLILVLTAAALAWGTYALVEAPIRFTVSRRPVVAGLCVAMLGVGMAGISGDAGPLRPRSADTLHQVWDAANDWHPFDGFERHTIGSYTAYSINAPAGSPVLFMGDSNVEQLGPRLRALTNTAPRETRSATILAIGGCPPIPGVVESHHPACPRFTLEALDVARSPQFEAVVIGGCWNCYLVPEPWQAARYQYVYRDNGPDLLLGEPAGNAAALASIEAMLADLASRKTTYLLLNIPSGTPMDPKQMIARTLAGFTFAPRYVPRTDVEQRLGTVRHQLVALAKRAGALVIDPLETICTAAECPTMQEDGRPIYKDGFHLRSTFAATHATFIDPVTRLDRAAVE